MFDIIVCIESIGINSGSVPLNPKITAKSVACPFPVKESEPYKSTLMCVIASVIISKFNFFIQS